MKFNALTRIVAILCVAGSVLAGCSSTNEPSSVADNSTNKSNATVASTGGDCTVDCIEEGGPYFEKSYSQYVQWGGSTNTKFNKTVDVIVYNTESEFVMKVRSTEGFSDAIVAGVSTGLSAAANVWGTYTTPLADGWEACDVTAFLLQIAGNGPQAVFNVSYNLIGICPEITCVTQFTGAAVACGEAREAVYTFSSVDAIDSLKIQGGLTNFTGADAVVTIEGGNLVATQKTPGGSSNRVITIKGSVEACEVVTITITWGSENGGSIITGSWSASGGDLDVPNVEGLTCE